jgi:hypothetical protein
VWNIVLFHGNVGSRYTTSALGVKPLAPGWRARR